jgi:hypothetical protein
MIGLGSDDDGGMRLFTGINRSREHKKQCTSAKQFKTELSILPGKRRISYASPALVTTKLPPEQAPARLQGLIGRFLPSDAARLLTHNRFLRHCSHFPPSAPGLATAIGMRLVRSEITFEKRVLDGGGTTFGGGAEDA